MKKSPIHCLHTIRADVVGVLEIIIGETLSLVQSVTCLFAGCKRGIINLDRDRGLFPGSCH